MNKGELPDSLSSAERALVDQAAKEALRGLRFHMAAGIAAAKREGAAAATVEVPYRGVVNGRSPDLLANHPLRATGPGRGIDVRLTILSLVGLYSLAAVVVATVLPRRIEVWPLLLLAIVAAAGVIGAMVGASAQRTRLRAVETAPAGRGALLATALCALAALVLMVAQNQGKVNGSPGQPPSAQARPLSSAGTTERLVDDVEIVKLTNRDGLVDVTAQINGPPSKGTQYFLVAQFRSRFELVGKLPSSLGTHVVRANMYRAVPGSWVFIVGVGPAAAREWEASTERPLFAMPDGTKKLDCVGLT